jgi:hypothetical protein
MDRQRSKRSQRRQEAITRPILEGAEVSARLPIDTKGRFKAQTLPLAQPFTFQSCCRVIALNEFALWMSAMTYCVPVESLREW